MIIIDIKCMPEYLIKKHMTMNEWSDPLTLNLLTSDPEATGLSSGVNGLGASIGNSGTSGSNSLDMNALTQAYSGIQQYTGVWGALVA